MRIDQVTVKNNIQIKPNNLTIVIGANDSGKSTFIRECYIKGANISTTTTYRWRWIEDIKLSINVNTFEECRKILTRSVVHKYSGNKDLYYVADWRNEWGDPDSGDGANITKADYDSVGEIQSELLLSHKQFRSLFFSYSSCESRLRLTSPTGLVSIEDRATEALNLFHRREHLFKELINSINERFNYDLLLLDHVGTRLELGTSPVPLPDFSSIGDKNEIFRLTEEWKRENFTSIQESGHGLRSMVRILETLFDMDKMIKLFDEPEMHLYPAQKIWLGGKIAELTVDDNSQTIVSTHDVHILQGILDKRPNATILRFSNINGERNIHMWDLLQDPTPTTDAFRADFLTGLFHNYCITVESESDRLFYNEMKKDSPTLINMDVVFIPTRGEGGTLNVARLAKAVNQRAAFILDLDVVFEKPNVIRKIINNFYTEIELKEITKLEELIQKLKEGNSNKKWKTLIGYTDRLGPSSKFLDEHSSLLNSVLNELEKYGVFLVPNGSLESWAPDVESKVRFPENAPSYIRADAALHERIKYFLKKVGLFLSE